MDERIAVFGGTFNPIHNAHLLLAEQVRERYNLKKIIFIPAGKPPHKKHIDIEANQYRYEMIKLAIKGNPHFELSNIEINRKGYSYTVDTINEVETIYNNYKINFLIGSDNVEEIRFWKKPKELLKKCSLIVVMRPGYSLDRVKSDVEMLKKFYDAQISLFDSIAYDLSSTNIRERIRDDMSIKYMMPDSVKEYILKNNIYKGIAKK